jgi:hypothetical protein
MGEKKIKVRFTHNEQEVEMRESIAKLMESKKEPNRVVVVKAKPGRPRKIENDEELELKGDEE